MNCIIKEGRRAHINETNDRIDKEWWCDHMNGTDVCIPFDEEGRYAHMKGTDVCISTEAHINEAWTDAHIDNIDEEWMEVCINPSRVCIHREVCSYERDGRLCLYQRGRD